MATKDSNKPQSDKPQVKAEAPPPATEKTAQGKEKAPWEKKRPQPSSVKKTVQNVPNDEEEKKQHPEKPSTTQKAAPSEMSKEQKAATGKTRQIRRELQKEKNLAAAAQMPQRNLATSLAVAKETKPLTKATGSMSTMATNLGPGTASMETELKLRAQLRLERQKDAKTKQGVPESLVEEVSPDVALLATQIVTAEALEQSWLNVIDTFGVTLIYINFHFIMKYIASVRSFCEFGEEWTLKAKAHFKMAGGKESGLDKITNTSLKWAEIISLFLIDILFAFLVGSVIYIIYALVTNTLTYQAYNVLPTPIQSLAQPIIEKVIK